MPRLVDHDARRRHVAEIAADLVADRGIDGLTVRDIADASGYSTTIVSYYFADKRDLLLATYEAAAGRQTARFEQTLAEGRPMLAVLEALLPTSDASRRDWRLSIAFWGIAASDSHLAEDQQRRGRSYHARIESLLRRELRRVPDLDPADLALAARSLMTATTGIGMHATFDPEHWPARRQREVLRYAVARVIDDLKNPSTQQAG